MILWDFTDLKRKKSAAVCREDKKNGYYLEWSSNEDRKRNHYKLKVAPTSFLLSLS